jgi:hypothetical protein
MSTYKLKQSLSLVLVATLAATITPSAAIAEDQSDSGNLVFTVDMSEAVCAPTVSLSVPASAAVDNEVDEFLGLTGGIQFQPATPFTLLESLALFGYSVPNFGGVLGTPPGLVDLVLDDSDGSSTVVRSASGDFESSDELISVKYVRETVAGVQVALPFDTNNDGVLTYEGDDADQQPAIVTSDFYIAVSDEVVVEYSISDSVGRNCDVQGLLSSSRSEVQSGSTDNWTNAEAQILSFDPTEVSGKGLAGISLESGGSVGNSVTANMQGGLFGPQAAGVAGSEGKTELLFGDYGLLNQRLGLVVFGTPEAGQYKVTFTYDLEIGRTSSFSQDLQDLLNQELFG